MTTQVRTRFAPSPTGYLHIGSARTALYAWLYAKKTEGTFILRIEDTDLERSTQESIDAILDGMQWLGLNHDEGPFYQTNNFDRYRAVIAQLLNEGKAYRCYCSKERLEALRSSQMDQKQKPRYDGHCRHLADASADTPHVVRFKNPEAGAVTFHDLIRGELTFQNEELDDLIIARSDGTPTYNFTVVVDDYDMRITHVIRGDDHINNTPRQINILRALGAALPQYAHAPMILGSDGKRLSKRHGAVGVQQYREDGYLPHALLNYLARLGWSHGDQEIFTMEELIRYFDIPDINRAPAAFNPEKLLWLNHHYIKTLDADLILPELAWHFARAHLSEEKGPSLVALLNAQRDRSKTLKEMVEQSRFFYEVMHFEEHAKVHLHAISGAALEALLHKLEALPSSDWVKPTLHETLKNTATELGIKLGELAQPLRVAVTFGTISPSIDITLELLGKETTLKRLKHAVKVALDQPKACP